jgi:hypothetical protein
MVTLDFEILRRLVGFSVRSRHPRHCCARSVLRGARLVGDPLRLSYHLLRPSWLGRWCRVVYTAEEAAKLLLRGRSRRLWDEALRSAPASALMFSLESLRVADDRDPADAVVWCSADQLAAAPRRFAWLIGLTTSGWPRSSGLDPILPDYIIPSPLVDPDPIEAGDRRCRTSGSARARTTPGSASRSTWAV